MVRFEDVTKIYLGSDRGVSMLSFELRSGITGFLGRNGSGKTTTMRLLSGLLMPDQGRLMIDGKDLWQAANMTELKRNIGFLPNEDYYFHKLTGRENLEYLSLLKTRDRTAYRDLDNIAKKSLDIDESLARPFGDYSSGMRKKVQILGALIGDPKIVVLDEPFNGLDVMANIVLNRVLLQLRDRGKVVFVSSHLANALDSLADRVLIIEDGTLAGEISAPFEQPVVDLYVRAIEAAQDRQRSKQRARVTDSDA